MPKDRERRDEVANALGVLGVLGPTRVRRGRVVQIPEEWLGHVPSRQTIRKRPSKSVRKLARAPDEWKGFGRIDQERYERIQADGGKRFHSPGHPRTWCERLAPKRFRPLTEED